MLLTALDWLLSLPVDHSRQPVALKWDGSSLGWCQLFFFQENISSQNWYFFLDKKYLFQIKWNKIISKYKRIHILLVNVHLDCRGGGGGCPVTGDESVETGDESVETGDESIEAGEKHNNHVVYCQKMLSMSHRSTSLVPECQRNNTEEHGPDGKKFRWIFDKNSTILMKQDIWKWYLYNGGHYVSAFRIFPVL